MDNIDIDILIKKISQMKINIIDIRNSKDYYSNKIPTAINVEEQELITNPQRYLDKTKTYYIYCNSGKSSKRVVYYLNNLGYHTVNINGGFNNYLLRK